MFVQFALKSQFIAFFSKHPALRRFRLIPDEIIEFRTPPESWRPRGEVVLILPVTKS